jgi:hypothetical protein
MQFTIKHLLWLTAAVAIATWLYTALAARGSWLAALLPATALAAGVWRGRTLPERLVHGLTAFAYASLLAGLLLPGVQ